MKTRVVLFLLLSLSFNSCIGRIVVDKSGDYKLSKENFSFIQEYETPEDLQLNLSTVGGNIEVTGYQGNRVKVAFIVTKYNGDVLEMTLGELQKYANFLIKKEGPTLSIEVKEIFKRNMSIGFRVQAPIHSACRISTSGGNLELANLIGNQEMNTSGGNISLDKVEGSLNAHTSGGNIDLNDLKGQATVSTSGGNIDGASIVGDLSAETSGGNIRLENHLGAADVSTSGGNIHLENLAGSVSARTSGGNVHAKLKNISQKLYLETSGGSIDCELPAGKGMNLDLSGSDIETNLNNFQGTTSDDRISGQINGGGIPVQMNCPSGTIYLKFSKL